MTPTQIESQKRQVAVDAERSWWVTKLRELVETWHEQAGQMARGELADYGLDAAIFDVQTLIAERTK